MNTLFLSSLQITPPMLAAIQRQYGVCEWADAAMEDGNFFGVVVRDANAHCVGYAMGESMDIDGKETIVVKVVHLMSQPYGVVEVLTALLYSLLRHANEAGWCHVCLMAPRGVFSAEQQRVLESMGFVAGECADPECHCDNVFYCRQTALLPGSAESLPVRTKATAFQSN